MACDECMKCSRCDGHGWVYISIPREDGMVDEYDHPMNTEDCGRCDGTGSNPEYMGRCEC